MSNLVVDSCVVAKWALPEHDSSQARRLITDVRMKGGLLFVLEIALPEAANAIWKQHHQQRIPSDEVNVLFARLLTTPVQTRPSYPLLARALDIAVKYDRSVYDALFVALADDMQLTGVTADEPLWRAVHEDFPNIVLLRDWAPTT